MIDDVLPPWHPRGIEVRARRGGTGTRPRLLAVVAAVVAALAVLYRTSRRRRPA